MLQANHAEKPNAQQTQVPGTPVNTGKPGTAGAEGGIGTPLEPRGLASWEATLAFWDATRASAAGGAAGA